MFFLPPPPGTEEERSGSDSVKCLQNITACGEHSDILCLMADTLRCGQVRSDPGEIKSNAHQTQLQSLHPLPSEDSCDGDLRVYTWQDKGTSQEVQALR